MTRAELDTVAALKDSEIAPLSFVETAALTAMLAQKDAAEKRETEAKDAHADELKAKDDERAQALAGKVAELDQEKADRAAEVAELKTLLGAAMTVPEGREIAKRVKLAELTATRQAAIDAKKKAEDEIVALNR